MKPRLIVTVDTEEDGLWGGAYPREGNTVHNIRGVERFQHVCDRFDVRPTYLVDAPVVQDDFAVELLSGIQRSGRAEIGAHLHPWCNPPFEEECTAHNSFLCNLPPRLQEYKIAWLTAAIHDRFDVRPTSFRAGRYGLDSAGAAILQRHGYLVDSSVIPFSDYSSGGGPDFERFPYEPYQVGAAGLDTPDCRGALVEVPVTVGYNRRDFRRAHAIRRLAMRPPLRQMRAVGLLDRLRLVQRIKFSPEQADEHQLKRLFDVRAAQGAACVVLMFHSSSLIAGGSPYVPDEDALERFHDRSLRVLEHIICDHGCPTATLSEFAHQFTGERQVFSSQPQISTAARPAVIS